MYKSYPRPAAQMLFLADAANGNIKIMRNIPKRYTAKLTLYKYAEIQHQSMFYTLYTDIVAGNDIGV